jgi:anti-sigma regulatory factor (Ser/Thr protein kinase)
MSDDEGVALAKRSVRLPAERERYSELVDLLEAFGRDTAIEQGPAWHDFLTAVSEIGANVLTYAYQDREPGDVELELSRFSDRVEARFRDWGEPFVEQPAGAPPIADDLLDPIFALEESGRGLAIARLALTSVDYAREFDGTNTWRLVKVL